MAAALGLLEEGRSAFSLRELARRAGVSAGAPYHHFADKDAVFAAVAQEGFEALGRAIDDAVASATSPETRLAKMAETYVSFAVAHFAHYQVMFDPALKEHEQLESVARAAYARLVQAVAAVAGDVDEKEVMRRAALAWSLSHGVTLLLGTGSVTRLLGEGEAEEMARRSGESTVAIALAKG